MINVAKLAKRVGVKQAEVIDMAARMKAHDLSLDRQVRETSRDSFADTMPYEGPDQEQTLTELQYLENLQAWTREALATLNHREKFIIEKRVLAEDGMTLNGLGKHLGITRERARQIERAALDKLGRHYVQCQPAQAS
jgi:RNA polymerase sigma-32 factor